MSYLRSSIRYRQRISTHGSTTSCGVWACPGHIENDRKTKSTGTRTGNEKIRDDTRTAFFDVSFISQH
jgi:hypothetical protein